MNRDLTPYAPTARAALQTAAIVRRLMCSALHEELLTMGDAPRITFHAQIVGYRRLSYEGRLGSLEAGP
jgi:hypothetical protein